MADLSVTARIALNKDGSKDTRSDSVSISLEGKRFCVKRQSLGIFPQLLQIDSDLETVGYMWFKNVGSVNIDIGLSNTTDEYGLATPFSTLEPGWIACFPAGQRANADVFYGAGWDDENAEVEFRVYER